MIFFSFCILHFLAYTFVTLSHKRVLLLVNSVRFFLYKAMVP